MRPCRAVKVSVIKMKPSYAVSIHTMEKHLDPIKFMHLSYAELCTTVYKNV